MGVSPADSTTSFCRAPVLKPIPPRTLPAQAIPLCNPYLESIGMRAASRGFATPAWRAFAQVRIAFGRSMPMVLSRWSLASAGITTGGAQVDQTYSRQVVRCAGFCCRVSRMEPPVS